MCQCALSVITTMALCLLMHLCTLCTVNVTDIYETYIICPSASFATKSL